MTSMTGYGFSQVRSQGFQIEVEVKGYNSRYLDIVHNINFTLSPFEGYVDEEVKKAARRGRVEITIRLMEFESGSDVEVDKQLVGRYAKAFRDTCEAACIPYEPALSDFITQPGVITPISSHNVEIYRTALEEALSSALSQFRLCRQREGEATRADLARLGESFKASNEKVGELVKSLDDYYRNAMLERYHEFLSDDRIDESQLLQEIGTLLVRYSINEEQNRLSTHIKEFFRLLSSDEAVGKRLDFLCQEMNREVNTTASKSQLVEVTLETVKMKDDLENIREQVRNVE